jgi:hypothetical protein
MVLFCVSAVGQVQIRVPQQHYQQHDSIDVVIANTSRKAVSFCVEFGHWSFRDADHIDATPTPVYVQRNYGGKWETLLIGPDIGSARHSVTIGPGESQHYPFRLNDRGKMRALIHYWIGESDRTCENPKRPRTAKSQAFVVE